MKLQWNTPMPNASLLKAAGTSLNSHPWRGFSAESVRIRLSAIKHGNEWTITAETIDTTEPIPGFRAYDRIDLNDVVPSSAVEV
jgi:hypothetical protein